MAALKPFAMPKWGIEMTEGTIADWMVKEGEPFSKGAVLTLIETDKITNEVEAEAPGVFAKIIGEPGQVYPVGALLAIMSDVPATQDEIDAFMAVFKPADALGSAGAATKAPVAPTEAKPAAAAAAAPAISISDDTDISPAARRLAEERGIDVAGIKGSGKGGRLSYQDVDQAGRPEGEPVGGPDAVAIAVDTSLENFYASPLAKRLASQHGVELGKLTGTGPRGRISKSDVLAHVKPAQVEPEYTGSSIEPISNEPEIVAMDKIRRVVARRLTEAKQSIPHFYVRSEASLDALMEVRTQANRFVGIKISINDFLIRATALALVEVPDCNVQVHGDNIHRFPHADISVAVATDKGLVTPIVRGADRLLPQEIAAQTKALIAKAQAGRLSFADMDGGSFSISNLGMFGVDTFDAIINPPQGAILAVGGPRRVWSEQADGSGAFETRIGFTLSCDHRAIDGAVGAQFLAALKRLIEAPEQLFTR
jgi:pyruvate dehydrogenase E2 component (dihydrolipoamide acetyltransferase)